MKTLQNSLKNHFFPHAGNDYRPHLLQKAALGGMTVLVMLTFSLSSMHALLWTQWEGILAAVLPAVVVDLTNVERGGSALGGLAHNPTLDFAAQMKAEHMAANNYFAHFSPDGVSPWFWFQQANYKFVHAGENLAVHFTDSSEVVTAWMKSPTHRANILNGDFTEIGIGVAKGTYEGFDTIFVVQMFGTPAATAIAPPAPAPVVVETPVPAVASEVAEVPTPAPVAAPETTAPIAPQPEPEPEPVSLPPAPNNDPVRVPVEDAAETDPIPVIALAPEVTELVEETFENTLLLRSELATTVPNAIPASIDRLDPSQITFESSFFERLLTQPHALLQLIYALVAALVVCALLLSLLFEIKKQHPAQIAYSVALLAAMGVLLTLHEYLTSGVLVV